MKIITTLLNIIILLFSFTGCEKNYTHAVYEVIIIADNIYNDSVGNDWTKSYTYDNKSIYSGEQFTIPIGTEKTISIKATITENDTWPDSNTQTVEIILKDGFEKTSKINVIENKGRYSGNSALWEITYKVNLVEKIEKHTSDSN